MKNRSSCPLRIGVFQKPTFLSQNMIIKKLAFWHILRHIFRGVAQLSHFLTHTHIRTRLVFTQYTLQLQLDKLNPFLSYRAHRPRVNNLYFWCTQGYRVRRVRSEYARSTRIIAEPGVRGIQLEYTQYSWAAVRSVHLKSGVHPEST